MMCEENGSLKVEQSAQSAEWDPQSTKIDLLKPKLLNKRLLKRVQLLKCGSRWGLLFLPPPRYRSHGREGLITASVWNERSQLG